jgi:aspartate racemase
MKTLGLIGGTTWVSTQDYYKHINKEVNRLLGGHNAAKLILYNLNFHEVVKLQDSKDFDGLKKLLTDAGSILQKAGVDGIMLCANTMHKYADAVTGITGLPLVHIADETAAEINKSGFKTAGLLGTKTTMEEPFYKERLKKHGITAIVPDEKDQVFLHRAIFDELGKDIFKDETRQEILRIMTGLYQRGAEGIILGCTEIPLIIKPEHTSIPLFDTLLIHARAGARFIAET